MTKTVINIGEEILNFFKLVKPPIKPPDRNKLLREPWEVILENVSIDEKVKIYHCFCAYEKAYFEFEDNDIHIGQNSIDYADYHSFEIEGKPKILLTVLREQALALCHYQAAQYPEALESLKESDSNLKNIQDVINKVNYLQTIQEFLLVNVYYATGEYETASEITSGLIEFWARGCNGEQDQINFSDNIEAQRPQVIHYLTDRMLLCVHNVYGDNEDLIVERLNHIFKSFNQTNASTCPVAGYEKAVKLLFSYNKIDDSDTYVPSLVNLFPVLADMPIFIQYYLFKKLIRIMEFINYPEHVGITHELKRYFSYLGIGHSDSLKNYKPDFIKRET